MNIKFAGDPNSHFITEGGTTVRPLRLSLLSSPPPAPPPESRTDSEAGMNESD